MGVLAVRISCQDRKEAPVNLQKPAGHRYQLWIFDPSIRHTLP